MNCGGVKSVANGLQPVIEHFSMSLLAKIRENGVKGLLILFVVVCFCFILVPSSEFRVSELVFENLLHDKTSEKEVARVCKAFIEKLVNDYRALIQKEITPQFHREFPLMQTNVSIEVVASAEAYMRFYPAKDSMRWTPSFGQRNAEIKLGFQVLRH